MDTPEKQKERNYILEKRNKIRRQFFPIRVALYGVISIGIIAGFKNDRFVGGWFLRLLVLVGVLIVLTYVVEAVKGRYKRK